MKVLPPLALAIHHDLTGFDCGKEALNEWLIRYALQAQASGSARTFVVLADDRIVGYYSLTIGQIDVNEATIRIRKGMPKFPIPVVILARLAVSLQAQGKGLGVGMLQSAIRQTLVIAEHAGVRALLTHPIDSQAEAFYRKFGFEPSPLREQQLLLLLKDARKYA